jgi:hypothetical protein
MTHEELLDLIANLPPAEAARAIMDVKAAMNMGIDPLKGADNDNIRPRLYSNAWYMEQEQARQQQPPPFNPEQATERLQSLDAEARNLQRNPNDENVRRLQSIETEMAKIFGQFDAVQSAERAAEQGRRVTASQPEISQLNADMEELSTRYQAAARHGSEQEQKFLENAMEARRTRLEQLSSGTELQWKGGEND